MTQDTSTLVERLRYMLDATTIEAANHILSQQARIEELEAGQAAWANGSVEYLDRAEQAEARLAIATAQLKNASWLLADISPDGLVKKQIDEALSTIKDTNNV